MTADEKSPEWRAILTETIVLEVKTQGLLKHIEAVGDDPEQKNLLAEEAEELRARGEELLQQLAKFVKT